MSKDEEARRQFLKMQGAFTQGVFIPRVILQFAANYSDALLLSQIVYWHSDDEQGNSRLKVEHGGRLWLAKADSDWEAELGLPGPTARDALKRLKDRGLIAFENHGFGGEKCRYIRLNWTNFLEAWKRHSELPPQSDGIHHIETKAPQSDGIHQTNPTESVESNTETTTETMPITNVIGGREERPPPVSPSPNSKPKKRKPYWGEVQPLVEHFSAVTKLSVPPLSTKRQFAAATQLWKSPLTEIQNLSGRGAKQLISQAVREMRNSNLTISDPNSIRKVAISLYAQRRSSGVSDMSAEEFIESLEAEND